MRSLATRRRRRGGQSQRWLGVALAIALLAGCGGDDAASTADGGVDASIDAIGLDAGVDPSAVLFRPDHILEVQITLAPSDWASLRQQPIPTGQSDTTCASQPTQSGYTYFPGIITIDGATTGNVGLRKKGSLGSNASGAPGLKVKANQYVMGQRIAGLKQLTLNNNHQDPTLISQCLGYGLFQAAGVPAPRCSFAHVTVNGEDLGVYSNVESINPDFLGRHFADDSGNLYESGGEFAPGRTGSFSPKTHSAAPDCSDLDPVVTALAAPDTELPTRLGAVLNIDEFLRFWAMEVITDHWDGYANNQNNFFFYHDPTSGQINFIPWGIDSLFTERTRSTRPDSVFACGSLPWRLYDVPATRARYLAMVRHLLATVWNPTTIVAEIDRMQALLGPVVDPTNTGEFASALDQTRAFVMGRAAALRVELDAGDPVWPYAAGDASCRIHIGSLSTTFSTTWGTLGRFGIGSGSMSGTVATVALASSTVNANAGLDSDGKAAVQILARLGDGRYAVVFAIINNPANVTVGAHSIDLLNNAAVMTFYDPATDTASGGGLILPGTITLTNASTVDGATIAGTVAGEVLEL
jgi:spore coat protein CotH